LTEWLRWGAARVSRSTGAAGEARGFMHDEKKIMTQWPPVQEPRLFAPPDFGGDVTVALEPINLDPDTLTATGYTESAPAAAATPASVPAPVLAFPASTLGPMRESRVLAGGHQMLGAIRNQIVSIDLDHGAVLWRQRVSGDLISFDVSPSGEIAVLDESGAVSIVNRSSAAAAKAIVPGSGYYIDGLVRWLKPEGQLLVVLSKSITVYDRDGKTIRSFDLPNMGVYSPVLTPARDWLYMGDGSGKVLSYQVPSLIAGPVLQNASAARVGVPGAAAYVISIVIDHTARHLIRIMNDGSFTEAQLPSLTPDGHPLIQLNQIRAASFSADGKRLFVADPKGTIQSVDMADGVVKYSWPATLDSIEALTADAQESQLVASGKGGVMTLDLKNGKVRTSIPGGRYFATAEFAHPGALAVELAGQGKVRTFRLPAAGETSSAKLPDAFFPSPNGVIGKTPTGLELWNRQNASESKELALAGEGRLETTPDGRYLAWIPAQSPPGPIEVLDTVSRRPVRTISPPDTVSAYALSPDGRFFDYLVSGTLHIVPLSDMGPESIVPIPEATCCVMVISAAADRLLMASNLGQVMLYDLASKRVLRSIKIGYAISQAAFAPAGKQVVLATSDGEVLLWNPSTTGEPSPLGTVEGDVVGIAFNNSGATFLASTDLGSIGWFSLTGSGRYLATTTWLESSQSWLTLGADWRFTVTGDSATPVGTGDSKQMGWKPAAQQPGYTPGLLNELLAQ
jgi:WD40 repeat protein